jgi:hypothetical protein
MANQGFMYTKLNHSPEIALVFKVEPGTSQSSAFVEGARRNLPLAWGGTLGSYLLKDYKLNGGI